MNAKFRTALLTWCAVRQWVRLGAITTVVGWSGALSYAQDRTLPGTAGDRSIVSSGTPQVAAGGFVPAHDAQEEIDGINHGDDPEFDLLNQTPAIAEVEVADVDARRAVLRDYFTARRARLNIVATTVTDSGQVIDWIPRDSQVPSGRVASPPKSQGTQVTDTGDESGTFELAVQPHARGPAGTVPVLRRDVDEVLNNISPSGGIQDFLSKYGTANHRGGPEGVVEAQFEDPGSPAHEYAHTAQFVENFGGEGNINLWNPYVWKDGEFSLGQVAVSRSSGGSALQTVETGWQDYKNLYGDYSPHFFIYYTTNGYASQGDNVGGYNRDVDGWVQYSSTVFPGAKFTQTSVLNGSQYSQLFHVELYQGNWWIMLGTNWVGYYPASLFATSGLRSKANRISWYGEIVDLDDGTNTSTDMGSGQFANQGFQKAAYMRNIWYYKLSDGKRYQYNPGTTGTTPGCYTLDTHFISGTTWESYFYFGGPGKSSTCP